MFSFERCCHETAQTRPAQLRASNCVLTTYSMIAAGKLIASDYRSLPVTARQKAVPETSRDRQGA